MVRRSVEAGTWVDSVMQNATLVSPSQLVCLLTTLAVLQAHGVMVHPSIQKMRTICCHHVPVSLSHLFLSLFYMQILAKCEANFTGRSSSHTRAKRIYNQTTFPIVEQGLTRQ